MRTYTVSYSREGDRRTARINFRLPSPEAREQLEAAAMSHGTTINGYVRALVLDALRKEQEHSATFFG
ncbi:MAG: Arc family DNA-binding protein [Acidimicrobiia bacterium]|nr:Arc family DNA-binding protein [Acidimicrobiia bacterium]